jgi:hypothetical protein
VYPAAFTRHAFVLRFEPGQGQLHSIASEGPNRAGDEYKLSHMIVAARTLERVFLVTRNHHGFVRRYRNQVHLSAARSTPHVGNLALDDALILTESPRLSPLLPPVSLL